MSVSHFLFRRGSDQYEVFVAKKWDEQKLQETKQKHRQAEPLFLEEDDFTGGSDVFALDLLLMKLTGKLLEEKDILSSIVIQKKDLRTCLESEVRRLAAKTRTAHHLKQRIPESAVSNTLQGIAEGLKYLGHTDPFSPEDEKLFSLNLSAAIFPRKRTGVLLTLLQRWEKFLQEK